MSETKYPCAVVVVGASGFVGRNLVAALAGRVEHLVGVTNQTMAVAGCSETVTLDRIGELSQLPVDTVLVHAGAYRYDAGRLDLAQSDILRHNTDLNGRIFQFCAERKIAEVRLTSSVAVYEDGLQIMDDAIDVDLNRPPFAGELFYAWSKRWAEQLAVLYRARFGVNSVVFRLSNPYGPHDSVILAKSHVAPAFVMKALNADPVFSIRGDPSVERDFIFVGDVVNVILQSLGWRSRNDTFNLCTGRNTTLLEFAKTALAVAGLEKQIEAGAPGAFGPAARRATADRVKSAFGLTFADLRSGLEPTILWYRDVLHV